MPDNEGLPIQRVSTSVARATMDWGYTKAVDPSIPTSISGKRRSTQVDPELGAQKRQRRTGNLAEGTSNSHEFSEGGGYPSHFTRYWH